MTPEEYALSQQPGNSPEQLAAREKVVRAWHDEVGLGQAKADEALTGIDLNHPVHVTEFPPPPTMDCNVGNSHGYPGNWMDAQGGQDPGALGVTDRQRTPRTFDVNNPQPPDNRGLVSTAAPIDVTWEKDENGDPLPPVHTPGGGEQTTVSNGARDGMTCSTCGGRGRPSAGGNCTCW